MKTIPYGRQDISQEDIQAVIAVLQSDWLTQGPGIEQFEQKVAEYCGAKYAVAVNSATSALHIACMAAGLGEGDILWTSPNTFVASANCGRYCGATVDFVDIDFRTYNMSIVKLEEKLVNAKREGTLPKVVIPVHFSGQSCEMEQIFELAKEYGFAVIEDASHAIGGRYKDQKVGSCAYSEMTVFSFHPVKIVTTAEGGMVLTNNIKLYEKLIQFRSHGITRNSELMTEEAHGPWYYQQIGLGYNYRITDIQAALGFSQMARIDEFVTKRQARAEKYNKELQGLPIILPWQHPDTYSAYHLYVICLEENKITKTHKQVFEDLRQAGIGVNLHYIPVHTQPYYQQLGFEWGDFPVSECYYQQAISIPMYSAMMEIDQDYVIKTLKEVLA
ncbi:MULTISPECIES: UDP-4-amino-4,6-dideoxy-N-acetyl-beta-L-altrosamine transaminase [Pelosinus]|uniref:UDP-4-keto-6-deoxy-N-acetylglucosamine 4-aminotransferase n=1 Tax=Pelosinus fermentans B4 TaxID=1149862 RepID=I9B718_9FIRM|nr:MULTISPECIES: UDP-4-amino-4,6-dideoxy-N-acetyl-beta-L-altrosamine transaminase [Pelosinus]EIW20922.1 UDP-4-keto-6-deoxy-N-acetylglucosamine 4-aminotransferase [Pelosinus fermentans B4]EIW27211.1 UDP-4-keto-6-deoxy-N-acetylglucosamine 4-aminotransferase [Pelosinus fermentans A11]